jgi:hypothetical protein
MSRAVSTVALADGSLWCLQLVDVGSSDQLALYVVQSDEGWELRSGTGRGIIFSSSAAATDLARTWAEDGHPVVVPSQKSAGRLAPGR